MVLLHGLLGSSRNWQTTGADLAATYHVWALDLRNHGKSPHAGTISYPDMVDDVLAWMDAHGIRKATLLGHSLGGKVAMLIACRHPGRVERLVVVDIAPKSYLSNAHRAEFAAMNELDLGSLQSRSEAELCFEARVSDWAMRKFLATNLERTETGGWGWQINLPVLTGALPDLEANPLSLEDKYEGATTFVLGGRSRYVDDSDRAGIVHHFPHAELRTIADAGHNPHMEARGAFVKAVLS